MPRSPPAGNWQIFEINQLKGFFDTGSFLSAVKKYTDIPRFRLKPAGLGWAVLLLVCAWPSGVLGQSGEGPVGTGELAKPKISVYDRGALSILIDAPAGVKLEVQGSPNLVDWKRLAELTAGDKPLIWNPPSTLKGGNHFFRVTPMGGPDEAHGGGDTEDGDGGGENPGGPDVEEPDLNDPFDPGFTDGNGPMVGFTEIDHDSELAKALAEEMLAGIEGQKLELIEVEEAAELSFEEEGTIYFIAVLAKDAEGNEFVVSGEFMVGDDGERKLDLIEVEESIDPASDLAKRLAKLVMGGLHEKGLELSEIFAVNKLTEDIGEFYVVHLEALNGEGDKVEVFGEVEADEQGELKLVRADTFDDGDPFDPFGPDNPDDGIETIQHIDPESDLGKALIKAATAHVEDAGLELVDVIAMDRVKLEDRELIEVVLLAKDAEGNQLLVLAEVAETADGGFDIIDVDMEPIDPIDPGFGGVLTEDELDPKSDLVQKLVTLALEHSDTEGLELDQVTGALRLSFGPDETVYLIDFLVKDGEGEVTKAFAEIIEIEDGQYKVGHVGIGGDDNWPHPEPEPEPHGVIVPPEGSRSHFIDPQGDLASALVTIVNLTIGGHVKTPWEIEHIEEAVCWHVPGEGAQFALLAKGADANGKSGHLLAVLMRKDGSLTIELADVRAGINPDEPIQFPLPPGGGE
jgi:hypothetical protein